MRRAGIVATRREGKFIFCTLADEAVLDLSFPKIPSERIRAMRENQGIIRRDACHPLSAWDVCRQPVHVAAPA
jgi:hypothetical protein